MNKHLLNRNTTIQLLQIIGSPFAPPITSISLSEEYTTELFKCAFENRVELLLLDVLNQASNIKALEKQYIRLKERYAMTLSVLARASAVLSSSGIPHVVFKSVKPYPATPNDTDILCLGNKEHYEEGIGAFVRNGYKEHEVAPLQTNLYDPRGEGKTGPGKKGGTYYIDFYQDIAVDYFVYVNKKKLIDFVREQQIKGVAVKVLASEPELAIVMFHNVFPEKTFHLEHFYLPLYRFSDTSFNINVFCEFVENNQLTSAVRANLALIEVLHRTAFGSVPAVISSLLDLWGREQAEVVKLQNSGIQVPYYFTAAMFWKVFLSKLKDRRAFESVISQCFHMLNPKFFADVTKIVIRRTLGYEKYEHEW